MQINLYICTDGNEDTRITTENNIVSYPCTGRMPGSSDKETPPVELPQELFGMGIAFRRGTGITSRK